MSELTFSAISTDSRLNPIFAKFSFELSFVYFNMLSTLNILFFVRDA